MEQRMFFRKKIDKWHEVRWFSGPRDIYLALQFGGEAEAAHPPKIERLKSQDPAAIAAQQPLDERQIVSIIQLAVIEYNKRNLCDLRVAGVRYRPKGGAEAADHGSAARKLLNLL